MNKKLKEEILILCKNIFGWIDTPIKERFKEIFFEKIDKVLSEYPVCTETERKFLDKIKKDGEYDDDFDIQTINIFDKNSNHYDMMCTFNSVVFSNINLKDLIDGK